MNIQGIELILFTVVFNVSVTEVFLLIADEQSSKVGSGSLFSFISFSVPWDTRCSGCYTSFKKT